MATVTSISLAEYMATNWRPDREFVGGEVRERNVGKWDHARVQWLLAAWFCNHESEWGTTGSTEQRMQVSADDVRIPDLVVLATGPQPPVLTEPPLLVVEILSPDDTYVDTQQRAQDYRRMGVETVWLIDPKTCTGRVCRGDGWTQSKKLTVPETPIYVDLDAIFSRIQPA